MLLVEPTRYGAGVTLWGDSYDLDGLRETIYDLHNDNAMGDELATYMLGLAYEVRHACQGDRLKQRFGDDAFGQVTYRGSRILWPVFLVQVALLREAASWQPTTRQNQAHLYALEAETHSALVAMDRGVGEECFELLPQLAHLPHSYLTSFITLKTREYVATRSKRFWSLPGLLRSLNWYLDEYREYAAQAERIAQERACRPQDLQYNGDWPDFRW